MNAKWKLYASFFLVSLDKTTSLLLKSMILKQNLKGHKDMWLVTNNIDLHSIEWEVMFVDIRVRRLRSMNWKSSSCFQCLSRENENRILNTTRLEFKDESWLGRDMVQRLPTTVIWLYQLSWKCKLATLTSWKADVWSVSPLSSLFWSSTHNKLTGKCFALNGKAYRYWGLHVLIEDVRVLLCCS